MSAPDSKLTPWLRRYLRELREGGSVDRVEMYHTGESSPVERILVVSVADGVDADELGQELWDAAEQDASSRQEGRSERYTVGTFGADDRAPLAQFSFLVATGTPGIIGSNDPATEKGERAQVLRHQENLHRMLLEQSTYFTNSMRQELDRERTARLALEKQQLETFVTMQELLDKKHERDMDTARETAKAQRHEQIMGLLMSAAPLLMAQFLGGKGMPGAGIARDEGIREFLKALKPEEINGIIKSLEPAHAMVLMELYKSYSVAERERNPLLKEAEESETRH